MTRRHLEEILGFAFLRICMAIVVIVLAIIIYDILSRGTKQAEYNPFKNGVFD